jgi:hypothetical protein
MKRRLAIFGSLALVCISWSALHAAPRASRGKAPAFGVDPNAKKVDVFKATDDKQAAVQVMVQAPGSAILVLTNLTDQSLTIEVPLLLAAVPQVPQGANQAYYLATFGTPGAPQSLAIAVNPIWTAGVDKKSGSRKTNVKTNRKPRGDDDAKDEKKDEEKDAKKDEAKKGDSSVALVPLAPGAVQQVPLFSLGLEMINKKLAPRVGSPYTLAELDKISQAPEMTKLMERYGKGEVPQGAAQILAWHYHGRLGWDEMANLGIETEVAKHFADVVEGRAPADAPTTGKKKRR